MIWDKTILKRPMKQGAPLSNPNTFSKIDQAFVNRIKCCSSLSTLAQSLIQIISKCTNVRPNLQSPWWNI